MPFSLTLIAFATATACHVVAKLAGFGEAEHAAFLIMALACGALIGSLVADRREGEEEADERA